MCLLGVVRDITERKRTEAALLENEARLRELQAELLHVSRLSTAGEMASTLAHELNQPLTAAASAVKAARRMLASSPDSPAARADIREAMDLAAEQSLLAGQILRRLRDFVSRDGEVDKQVEDLAKLAEDAGALALAGAKERGIHVSFRFDPRLPPVLVDRIQTQQVLLNLIRNALEAMQQEVAGDKAPHRRELAVRRRPLDASWSRSRSPIPARASHRRSRAASSAPSSRPSQAAWAWACRSAARSLRPMAGRSGPNPTRSAAQCSASPCRQWWKR